MDSDKPRLLYQRVKSMLSREPCTDKSYFAFTVIRNEHGNMEVGCQTHSVGFEGKENRIELREASLVHADKMRDLWRSLGQSCVVVDDSAELMLFFMVGGNALIEKEVAESFIPDWLAPQPRIQSGEMGIDHKRNMPETSFSGVSGRPKLRMQILKRDDFRCKICGRRPADHLDLELHVHHIRPWANHGLTEPANLITLCHTCHKDLVPLFDYSIYGLMEPGEIDEKTERHAAKHWEGVRRYRESVKWFFED